MYLVNFTTGFNCVTGNSETDDTHGVLQFIILLISIGIPLVFLQNSIGQYTRHGCLFMGEMFPIAYGVGYSMLIISLSELFSQMYYSTKFVYYAITSTFNPSPPWMNCYSSYYTIVTSCVSGKDIDLCPNEDRSPCYQPERQILAAYLFKEIHAFGRGESLSTVLGVPWAVTGKLELIIFRVFNAAILYIVLLFGTSKSMKTFSTTLRIGIAFCLLLLASIVVVVFIQPGALDGVVDLTKHLLHSPLLSINAWVSAFKLVIMTLRLSEGGHILFGSFIPKRNPDYWRPMILVAAFVVLIIVMLLFYYFFLGLLAYKLSMPVLMAAPDGDETTMFVLFPTFLGILPSAYFFCLVYFLVLCLINFFSLAVKIIVIEKTITTYFRLSHYYVYVRFTICTLGVFVALLHDNQEILFGVRNISELIRAYELIIVCLQMIMVNLYGTQKISDDVEYMMMVKVKKYLQLVWIAMPLICYVPLYTSLKNIDFNTHNMVIIFSTAFLASPITIAFVVEFFKFAKKKSIIGLFRPTDRYGPPDVEDRILRVLYNPRLTVKYKRHVEVCFHECLLNSNAVKKAIEDEIDLINKFTRELQQEGGGKFLDGSVRLQFEKHQKYLLTAIKQESKNEQRSENE